MIKIKQAVIVEGKYDKIRLSSVIDALIITTDGFGIFKDDEKRELIKRLAEERGIIVLSDSDGAGGVIRGYLKNISAGNVINLYIPQLKGKEKRKSVPSKEGTLGVEGMENSLLASLFKKFEDKSAVITGEKITPARLFEDGLSGKPDSARIRAEFCRAAGLPQSLNAKALLEAVNALLSVEEYDKIINTINGEIK